MVNLHDDFVVRTDLNVDQEVLLAFQPLVDEALYNVFVYHKCFNMKNEGLLKAPHSSERVQSYEYFRHTPNVLRLFYQPTNDLDRFRRTPAETFPV